MRDRIVLVTGCTRGIGRAVAEGFAADGATVVGIYEQAQEAADHMSRQFEKAEWPLALYRGSVAETAFVEEVVTEVVARWGGVDVLVNNAGITRDQTTVTMTDEEWEDVLQVNYIGAVQACACVIPHMVRRGAGCVINVSSVTGLYGREGQTNYAAAKGALIGLTRLLARRYAKHGIAVHALAPGLIETDMVRRLTESKRAAFDRFTHLGRLGAAGEVARAVLALAQAGPDTFESGTVARVDGGFLR